MELRSSFGSNSPVNEPGLNILDGPLKSSHSPGLPVHILLNGIFGPFLHMTGDKKTATRQQIVTAAQDLFGSSGFKQTGMSQIAAACQMSAANLYRFFPSKVEIGEAVVLQHIAHSAKISELVTKLEADAQGKIRRFVLETLEYNYRHFHGKPHLLQLIEFVSQKLPHLQEKHKKIKLGTLLNILTQGQQNGQVVQGPVKQQAQLMMMALRGFLFPHLLLVGGPPLKDLNQQAEMLVKMMFSGIGTSVDE